jgi:hypothetical protein
MLNLSNDGFKFASHSKQEMFYLINILVYFFIDFKCQRTYHDGVFGCVRLCDAMYGCVTLCTAVYGCVTVCTAV